MAGSVTNGLNSYPLLVVGKVLAAIGDGSLDNAQHRIFSTYFAPGRGFAFSIGKGIHYLLILHLAECWDPQVLSGPLPISHSLQDKAQPTSSRQISVHFRGHYGSVLSSPYSRYFVPSPYSSSIGI